MNSLNDIKQLAVNMCQTHRQSVDIFELAGKLNFALTIDRNSGKYLQRLNYERGQIVIRDNKGKVIEKLGEVQTKKTAPKKSQNIEDIS